jgi:predicted nucleic-acid-binding Zn-ribbon protein
MSDNCLHIIPRHSGEYPQAEKKANEILSWFQDRDIVEKEPSACVLSMGRKGYRFTPNIATIFNDGESWAYRGDLVLHGLELEYGKRKVFFPGEGDYMVITCPNCSQSIYKEEVFDWINDWYLGKTEFFHCPHCHKKEHLTEYIIDPNWGFSNLAISLWNTHYDLKPNFLEEMKSILETEIVVVNMRI